MRDRDRLAFFVRQGEAAYRRMYDATCLSDATARYSDAKEAFHSAIGIAVRLEDEVAAGRLRQRLAEIKAVFRRQFPS